MTALGREGSSPSLRIGKELASASSLFFEIPILNQEIQVFNYESFPDNNRYKLG